MKAAVQALKTTEQQQQQGGLALRQGSASQRFTGSHFLASGASSLRDVEQGRHGSTPPLGGPFAAAGKLRAVWGAVGRVAGFLPPTQCSAEVEPLAGGIGSAVQLEVGQGAAGQHSSTSWGASSGPEGVSTGHPAAVQAVQAEPQAARLAAAGQQPGGAGLAAGGSAVRAVLPPVRQLRVAGTAAPQSAPGASCMALRDAAYPQV
jgi:hypothetical protein